MNIQKTEGRSELIINDGQNNISLFFLSAPFDFLSSENNGYFYIVPRKNISATVWNDEDVVNIILNRSTSYSSLFSLKIKFDFIQILDSETISFDLNETSYVIKLKGCLVKLDDDSVFLVSVNDSISSITISGSNLVINLQASEYDGTWGAFDAEVSVHLLISVVI